MILLIFKKRCYIIRIQAIRIVSLVVFNRKQIQLIPSVSVLAFIISWLMAGPCATDAKL